MEDAVEQIENTTGMDEIMSDLLESRTGSEGRPLSLQSNEKLARLKRIWLLRQMEETTIARHGRYSRNACKKLSKSRPGELIAFSMRVILADSLIRL